MRLKIALHLARAETRRARGTLSFCVLAVAIGALCITTIRSVDDSVRASLSGQARQILGADLVVEGKQPLRGGLAEELTQTLSEAGARSTTTTRFYSMLTRSDGSPAAKATATNAPAGKAPATKASAATKATTLSRVRAVGDGFPFYGHVASQPPDQFERLAAAPSVLVDPLLMRELGLSPGSRVRLGDLEATVLGELVKQPGSPAAEFSLAPQLFVHERYLPETGLLKTGSRVNYQRLFALPEGMSAEDVKERYWDRALDEHLDIETYEESAANVRRFLRRVSHFLTLVGLVTLLLGALGVGSAFHAFLRTKLDHAAILRCVGARPRDVLLVYSLLSLGIASVGSLIGVGLGSLAPLLLQRSLGVLGEGLLPADLALAPSVSAALHGGLCGLTVALVFTWVPLASVARVPPLRALGRDTNSGPAPGRRRSFLFGVLLAVATVLAIAVAETGSLVAASWFTLAVLAALGVLALLAHAGSQVARRLGPRLPSYHLRQGFANLHRPQNQTRAVVTAVGAGFLLLGTMVITQASLERALAIESRGDLPTLFAIDIQPEQHEQVREILARHAAEDVQMSPMIAARLQSLNGEPIERQNVERHAGRRTWEDRMRTREYFVTYREQPLPSEQVVSGSFWSGRPATQEVSLDERMARTVGASLGDELTLDIQGLPLSAKVTSTREIRWQAMVPNALVVLSPGEIEQAPKTYVVSARVEPQQARHALSQELVGQFPNVTVIDVSEAAATVLSIASRVAAVFSLVGLLATLTGAVILAGAVSAGRFARQRESTLLRVLGASNRDLSRILLSEYAALALLGVAGGWALTELLNRLLLPRAFDTGAHVPYEVLVPVALATLLLNVVVGATVGRRVSRMPPLATLRES